MRGLVRLDSNMGQRGLRIEEGLTFVVNAVSQSVMPVWMLLLEHRASLSKYLAILGSR